MEFLTPFRKGDELSQVEQWKLERNPLDVAESVRGVYARRGVDAIARVPGEQERLKWVGLYPQRQTGDAFMMRIKVPGGRLDALQARTIGELAEEYSHNPFAPSPVFGDKYCDITTRQTIQLHWLQIEDVPEIWRAMDAVGLTSVQACGDSARNVLCCPVAGIDAAEAFDAYPVARAISEFFTGNREYSNLPRKFKISVTGCVEDCAQAEINDIGMRPARHDDGTLGFNVLVGGGLSDGPRMASDIDAFVGIDEAVEVTRAIAQVFGELGNRENRGVSRMRYLVEELGPEGFRAELAGRTSFPLRTAGEDLTRRYRGDHIGVHDHREPGLSYVGLNVTVGRLVAGGLIELARIAESYGDGHLRLTTDQNVVIAGVPHDRIDAMLTEPVLEQHSPFPAPFERGAVACTGSEFCRFAVVETKEHAAAWARRLDEQLGSRVLDDVVRMHFSGCSASCAQPQIADIGLRGETAHVGEAIVEAVDVGLGGSIGSDAAFIDWVEGALPSDDVPGALDALLSGFEGGRREGETFRQWVRRVPNGDLRACLLAGAGR